VNSSSDNIEVWGGVECTVNRVGDRYFNQLELSGHQSRETDLDAFAALGLKTLRYPVLWETVAPDSLDKLQWSWADERLTRLRALGIRPIVGLLHHGSGPSYTNLLDPGFPEKLARFAGAVARRYPWIDAYTPVNEPLTTARFSSLYGHWFPHHRDERSLFTALFHQIKGTVLAMRAIREINPTAQLIQTDDLGRTFSTPPLAYQAEFENERRWLTWDLLCGLVRPGHRMQAHFEWLGLSPDDLDFFVANPCPPDVIGLNYYVTSERFLDHRIQHYPPELHGGNGRDIYADDAAVRARIEGIGGITVAIAEAIQRYQRPIALTEVHIGCSIEEQLRWLGEIWESAQEARAAGADVRALTTWALLGSHDWDSLVTQPRGHYEAGVFDVSGGKPEPTLLAETVRRLAQGKRPDHSALKTVGWWRRPCRLRPPVLEAAA
jgi:dTDP-4-dehydrorhamnose reductase